MAPRGNLARIQQWIVNKTITIKWKSIQCTHTYTNTHVNTSVTVVIVTCHQNHQSDQWKNDNGVQDRIPHICLSEGLMPQNVAASQKHSRPLL